MTEAHFQIVVLAFLVATYSGYQLCLPYYTESPLWRVIRGLLWRGPLVLLVLWMSTGTWAPLLVFGVTLAGGALGCMIRLGCR